MEACLFCKIAAKEIPARIVHETERVLAFEDIAPKAPHHILIIPKEHFASLNDLPADKGDLLVEVLMAARTIARERGISASGYRIVLNTARDSGQEVFHIHFHLLGGRRMTWPPG
jgi:histidine triad (HIT) family protein